MKETLITDTPALEARITAAGGSDGSWEDSRPARRVSKASKSIYLPTYKVTFFSVPA